MDALNIHAPALIIAAPLITAFLVPLAGKAGAGLRNAVVLAGMAFTSWLGLQLAVRVFSSGPVAYVFGAAAPSLVIPGDSGGIPVRILFNVDGMGAFMLVIVSVVAFACVVYSVASERKYSGQDGFYALLMLLVTGVLGMVSTGDIFNLFVFLEIASLAGASLAAIRIEKGKAVEAGLKYAVISTVGGLFFLLGIGLLFGQYGSLSMAQLASQIRMSTTDWVALVFLAVPMAMKCGAVPMHLWTPDTYSRAPSSVTAFLVVSSQASLYALFRILFTLYGVKMNVVGFGWLVVILGILSMFIGVTMALPQKDVKRLMAYHAVSQTGYMLLGVGVGLVVLGDPAKIEAYGKMAMTGGIFHIINHALYKGLLFLTAGAVLYRTGRRSLNELGGLGHTMPWTMAFFVIGALAIAGIPPFNGFASKFIIYESVFRLSPFLSVVAIVVSILTLASFMKVFHSIFMGPRMPHFKDAGEAPLPMLVGMGILAVGVVLGGLFPNAIVDAIISPAVNALVDQGRYLMVVRGGVL
jgi:multicomponent Na+:H+ antiporter subunit D